MNWATICGAIKAALELEATQIPAVWAYEARPMYDTPYYIMDVINEKVYGRDERHSVYDTEDDILIRHTEGQRGFTVSIQCRSRDQRPGYDSKHYVNIAIEAFGKQSVIDKLTESNIAVLRIGTMTTVPLIVADRKESIANVDIEFATSTYIDDTPMDYFITFEMAQAV
jgi:hypothetical protein